MKTTVVREALRQGRVPMALRAALLNAAARGGTFDAVIQEEEIEIEIRRKEAEDGPQEATAVQ